MVCDRRSNAGAEAARLWCRGRDYGQTQGLEALIAKSACMLQVGFGAGQPKVGAEVETLSPWYSHGFLLRNAHVHHTALLL